MNNTEISNSNSHSGKTYGPPVTKVTQWWNIVNGLILLRGINNQSAGVEEISRCMELYNTAILDFFEYYKSFVQMLIIDYFRDKKFREKGIEITRSDIDDIYLDFLVVARAGVQKPYMQRALEEKERFNLPFIRFVRDKAKLACKEWVKKSVFFQEKEGEPRPAHPQSLDVVKINGDGRKQTYIERNENSIHEYNSFIQNIPEHLTEAFVKIDEEEWKIDLKRFSWQILLETLRKPETSRSSEDCKRRAALKREFIYNPNATQKELAVKYKTAQQNVSDCRKMWKKDINKILEAYKPNKSRSDIIDNSPEYYKWLVVFVYERIGERKAPCNVTL